MNKHLERTLDIAAHRSPRAIAEKFLKVRGEWRDLIFRHGKLDEVRGWNPNQIQNTHAVLLASLAKNRASFDGYQFFALGSGLPSWDSASPTQPFSDTTLTTEVFRKAVPAVDITFRDASPPFASIEPTPSNVIQLDVTITAGEANGFALREFGIFGGNATGVADSGLMCNWITHARIDKDSSVSIQRAVRITYQVQ